MEKPITAALMGYGFQMHQTLIQNQPAQMRVLIP